MESKANYAPAICLLFLFVTAWQWSQACSCLSGSTEASIASIKRSDLVVKGKIIAVTLFDEYDTVGQTSANIPFDISKNGYLLRKLKRYTLVVENRYKTPARLKDTIEIITGIGDGDCGFQFQVGGEYIVFATSWRQKRASIRRKKRRIVEQIIPGAFSTNICQPTQMANPAVEERIKKLLQG